MAKQEIPKIQEVTAVARYIHMSPQKLRLVADLIRRARVDVALEQLNYSSKNAALPISKLLNSAIANATHNYNFKREDLVIAAITVDGGPVMKRMFPRAQGSADIIKRRMSHINITLISKPKTTAAKKSRFVFGKTVKKDEEKASKADVAVEEGKADSKNDKQKHNPVSDERVKKQAAATKRRLFNRKSGE